MGQGCAHELRCAGELKTNQEAAAIAHAPAPHASPAMLQRLPESHLHEGLLVRLLYPISHDIVRRRPAGRAAMRSSQLGPQWIRLLPMSSQSLHGSCARLSACKAAGQHKCTVASPASTSAQVALPYLAVLQQQLHQRFDMLHAGGRGHMRLQESAWPKVQQMQMRWSKCFMLVAGATCACSRTQA